MSEQQTSEQQALQVVENDHQAAVEALAAFSAQESIDFRPLWFSVKEMGFVSDVEQAASLDGVILAIRKTRRHSIYDQNSQQRVPECLLVQTNPDMGRVVDTGELRSCTTCPYNRWGSAVDDSGKPGRGKACREKRLLLFLRDGDALPIVVAAPPKSIRVVENFKNLMETKGTPLPMVHVTLKSRRETQGNHAFGVLEIQQNRILSPAEAAELWGRIKGIKARIDQWLSTSAAEIDRDDIEDEEKGTVVDVNVVDGETYF